MGRKRSDDILDENRGVETRDLSRKREASRDSMRRLRERRARVATGGAAGDLDVEW